MDLDKFYTWLVDRGREPRTAALYRSQVQLAYAYAGGPIQRILKAQLAPKSKRVALAAMRAYAKFTRDATLMEHLGDLRLPAAVRVHPKRPIDKAKWKALIKEIDNATYFPAGLGPILGVIAVRGLRVGDVLRIRRSEVQEACDGHVLSMQTKGQRRLEFSTKFYEKYLIQLLEITGWERVIDIVSFRGEHKYQLTQAIATVTRWLKKAAENVGLDPNEVHPHRLRRTYASAFL